MKKIQEAYLSMTGKSIDEMKRHESLWIENAVIAATMLKLDENYIAIIAASARQNRKTEGFTKQKKKYRKMLNKQSDVILGIIRSYAVTNGDDNLYENANLSISKISAIRDSEMLIKVDTITKIVSKKMAELIPFGISDKIMLDYSETAENYSKSIFKPQIIIAERRTATIELQRLFTELEIEFNDYLDNHMMRYKLSEPQFYSDYINARTIFDGNTISKSLMGTVTDLLTGKPLQYVKVIVKFKAGSELADKVKTTTAKGNYQFKSLPPGVYKVLFKLPFYTTEAADCVIHPNALTRLNAALQKK